MKKIICFDLDNVICKTKNSDYESSKPIKKTISLINKLYKEGYQINIFTARGMGIFNGNYSMVVKTYKKLTIKQLKQWKVDYHNLILGKPAMIILLMIKLMVSKKIGTMISINIYKNFGLV